MERDGLVVDLAGAALRQVAGEGRQRVRAIGRIGKPVDAGDHIIRRHRLAIVEFHPLPQLEGPHRAVLVGTPALGQHRLERQIVAVETQEIADIGQDGEPGAIGDLDRVDGTRRSVLRHSDGAARPGSPRQSRSGNEPDACGDRPKRCQAQAQTAAMADEFAAAQPAGKQAVDQLIMHLAMGAPKKLDKSVAGFHAGLP
jgi:hypothetical protein